jgi:O-antigen/teichoic acid export membrane protein
LIEGIGRPVLDGASIRQYLREGAIYCGGELPNQLYGRALILVVTGALGAQVGGVYVYIRQILSGAAQIIGLLKRVEITRLGAILCGAEFRWGQFFGAQAVNLAASVGVCLTAIIAFSLRKWLPGRFGEVAFYFAFFSAVLPVWALSASLGQALILQRQVETYSRIILLTLGLAAIATVSFTATFGLLFVAVCDVTMNLLQIALFAHSARRPA